MTQRNGNKTDHGALIVEDQMPPQVSAAPINTNVTAQPELATRSKLRTKEKIQQNRFVIVAAGAVLFALLVFAFVGAPHASMSYGGSALRSSRNAAHGSQDPGSETTTSSPQQSLLPITDSGRPAAKETHDGYLSEQDLERSGTRRTRPTSSTPGPSSENAPATLGSIPAFDEQAWQAPPYQPTSETAGQNESEREAFDKASLIFVRNVSGSQSATHQDATTAPTEYGLGLPTGTRLRARLESSASTAVRTPVLAVIDYNYERDGEIIVPAGSKAVGQIQEADRSGYMRIQFDSLILPDGASIPIQATATDLQMRPVKGKVEGKNIGKNVLVRSLSGIGQAGTMLLGRGSLNQPLSESDLIRERVSNNIGEASDEQIPRLAITARIVVSVSAGTPIYVVLEQSPKGVRGFRASNLDGQSINSESLDQLGQLLRLQQELKQTNTKNE